MRKKVEFELLSPLMCGGVRIADNFLESEQFIRGSVLRAAFANEILLECPFADRPAKNGRLNFIELKDEGGVCENCPNKRICGGFSDMRFSFAYPYDSIPAPFTAKVCKNEGTDHPIKDTILSNGKLQCDACTTGLKRMEDLKGLICRTENGYRKVSAKTVLTTHTAIDRYTHTAKDGKLYSVRAVFEGTPFTAVIDDGDTGMLQVGKILRAGKFSSAGFGKMRIAKITEIPDVTEETVRENIDKFRNSLHTEEYVSVLLLSDAILDIKTDKAAEGQTYTDIWQNALFGDGNCPVRTEKVFAETKLYSGFDTSRKWGNRKYSEPKLLVLKGTSLLLKIEKDRFGEAVELLTDLSVNGIGQRTEDGFGNIEICHEIHRIGSGCV